MVLLRGHGGLDEEAGAFAGVDLQLIVAILPDLGHVLPVLDEATLDGSHNCGKNMSGVFVT